jgi:hypothetical protein
VETSFRETGFPRRNVSPDHRDERGTAADLINIFSVKVMCIVQCTCQRGRSENGRYSLFYFTCLSSFYLGRVHLV